MYVDKEETDSTWIICRRYSGYLCWVCFLYFIEYKKQTFIKKVKQNVSQK